MRVRATQAPTHTHTHTHTHSAHPSLSSTLHQGGWNGGNFDWKSDPGTDSSTGVANVVNKEGRRPGGGDVNINIQNNFTSYNGFGRNLWWTPQWNR